MPFNLAIALAKAFVPFQGALPSVDRQRQVAQGQSEQHEVEAQGCAGWVGVRPERRLDGVGVGDLAELLQPVPFRRGVSKSRCRRKFGTAGRLCSLSAGSCRRWHSSHDQTRRAVANRRNSVLWRTDLNPQGRNCRFGFRRHDCIPLHRFPTLQIIIFTPKFESFLQ